MVLDLVSMLPKNNNKSKHCLPNAYIEQRLPQFYVTL